MRYFKASAIAAVTCLALSACVPAPEPTPTPLPAPAPAPAPTQAPAPPFTGNWMDAPLTPGDWAYRDGPGDTTIALFGPSPDRPVFSIGCYQPGRVVTLTRYEPVAPAPFRVLTETHEGSLVTRSAQPGPVTIAEISAMDGLLDAMAFSKGRFAVTTEGRPTLYIPSYPEVTRVIEDCR